MLEAVAWLLADGGRPRDRKGTVMAGADGGDAGAAVAVIGAGIMGSAMTRNLVAAGLTTRVWDRPASATGPVADAGAVVAGVGAARGPGCGGGDHDAAHRRCRGFGCPV